MTKQSFVGEAGALLFSFPRLNARQYLISFWGAIAMDRRLSGAPSGTAQRDLQNGINYWMKSIALSGTFCLLFAAVGKK